MPIGVNTPEEKRVWERNRKAAQRAETGTAHETRPFVGVDGEGFNVITPTGDTHHVYALLRAGEAAFHTGKELTTLECLDFLANLPPEYIYVGYFFDYDVTMILRGMPPERINRLLHPELRTRFNPLSGMWVTRPVDYEGYQIDYRAGKEFKVRRYIGPDAKGRSTYSPYITINDVGSFFQCRFAKSLKEWDLGTPEERAMIDDGKAKRGSHISLDADTIRYNALEVVLLESLMEKFRDVCYGLGIKPRMWQGPGQLAEALLKNHGVTKTKELDLPAELLTAGQAAYYGGRFETGAVGTVQGPIYAYDINSAYPDAARKLPCLIHGGWEKRAWMKPGGGVAPRPSTGNKPSSADPKWWAENKAELWLAHGSFEAKYNEYTDTHSYFGFPFRNEHGGILYPDTGKGWYWSIEIEAAVHQTFRIDQDYWAYNSQCDCTPFDWVPPLYLERLAMKETNMGGVLKLTLNSIYGKMCQSVGHPTYANPIWASLITAHARTKLANLMHYVPPKKQQPEGQHRCICENVIMVATDAVFTTAPLHTKAPVEIEGGTGTRPIKVTPNADLGGWDFEEHESIHIIMPGVYFKGADGKTPKTRGVPRQAILDHRDEFLRVGAALVNGDIPMDEAAVTVPLIQFQGLRVSNHRGRLDLAGEWLPCGPEGVGKTLRYRWTNKRSRTEDRVTINGALSIRTYPWLYNPFGKDSWGSLETLPYSKNIGKLLAEAVVNRWDVKDQPDWAEVLIEVLIDEDGVGME
jgi:hypothetical protein